MPVFKDRDITKEAFELMLSLRKVEDVFYAKHPEACSFCVRTIMPWEEVALASPSM